MSLFDTIEQMEEIKPNQIYTTKEAQVYLRVSKSTIKRFLKRGIIRANKIGGRYKILGKELLRLVSPVAAKKTVKVYQRLKQKVKKKIEKW